jgi:transposase-like protein
MGHPTAGNGNKLPPRRQYKLEFKRRIVEETFVPGASVSIVARRHDVNANMLFGWRKLYREGMLVNAKPVSRATTSSGQDLIRVGVVDPDGHLRLLPVGRNSSESSPTAPHSKEPAVRENDSGAVTGIIEIELPNRVKLRVPVGIGETALRRVLAVAGQPA